jgi:hypothetical protein
MRELRGLIRIADRAKETELGFRQTDEMLIDKSLKVADHKKERNAVSMK